MKKIRRKIKILKDRTIKKKNKHHKKKNKNITKKTNKKKI